MGNGLVSYCDNNSALINRPDLWIPSVEYNFGNNLYGQRFTGGISIAAGNISHINLVKNISDLIEGTGWWERGPYTNPDGSITYCKYFLSFGSDHYNNSVGLNRGGFLEFYVNIVSNGVNLRTISLYNRSNAPYQVMIKYKR
jgi:hypothetical protein